MKTNIISVKTLLVALSASAALTLAGTTSATAQSAATVTSVSSENPLNVRVNRLGETLNFEVRFEKPTAQKVTVDIQDDHATYLFRDVAAANTPRYARRFDLSGLEDGTYTFIVTNGKEQFKQSFEIRTQVQTSRLVVNKQ
jgi:hypothetical protein